jgi:hypothetical protein
MNVELADERVLVLADQFSMDHAEGRASAKKVDAFGTMARLGGLLAKPREDEYELIYRERRLQPFWQVVAEGVSEYDRRRDYSVRVSPEVQSVEINGVTYGAVDHEIRLSGQELCREEVHKDILFDGLTGKPVPELSGHLRFPAAVTDAETLAGYTRDGVVVVPPQVKASTIVREVLAGFMSRIEADKVIEEGVRLTSIDLYYRAVYAFRYRRQGKEAVVEFDGLTGEARVGGATFGAYVGKILEPKFLLDASVEAVNIFFPGATLAKIVIAKGMELKKPH